MEKTATYTYKHSDIFLRIIHDICKIKGTLMQIWKSAYLFLLI